MLEANALFEKMQFGVFCTRTKIAEAELTDRHIDEISLPVAVRRLGTPSTVKGFAFCLVRCAGCRCPVA